MLIVAGDNVFEFRLADFIDFYRLHRRPIVAFCDLKDVDKIKGKYGVGILDEGNKLIGFQEKPVAPKSTLASTGCYLYLSYVIEYLQDYLKGKNDPDAPGHFIEWLYHQVDLYGFVFDGAWYDIGSFESYDQANKDYKGRIHNIVLQSGRIADSIIGSCKGVMRMRIVVTGGAGFIGSHLAEELVNRATMLSSLTTPPQGSQKI